jgi:hypothetical protein
MAPKEILIRLEHLIRNLGKILLVLLDRNKGMTLQKKMILLYILHPTPLSIFKAHSIHP